MDETVAEHNASSGDGSENRILVVSSSSSQFDSLSQHMKVEKTGEKLEWKIDNKYYSVSILLLPIHSNELDNAFKLGEFGGIVLLFRGDHEEEFEREIKPWAKYVEEKEPSVCLCLALKGESENPKEGEDKLYMKYNEWCIDNGIEFVGSFSFESNEKEDDEEREDGIFGKDKIGMDRIVEAMESNMWPGMKYKTQQRPTSSKIVESFGNELEDFTSAITSTMNQLNAIDKVSNGETKQNEAKKESKNQANTSQKVDDASKKDNKKEIEDEMKRRAKSFFEEMEMMEEEMGDGDELKQLQSFEKALKQLNSVRDNAMNLSDKDRREMAARVALSFLSEMGEDESDDSDNEELKKQ